ncbi:hypothetical protein D7U74_14175 [Stenotrophomonas maltophilia]|nr:hypothetical protein [Stenotrophomonas maltophilia]
MAEWVEASGQLLRKVFGDLPTVRDFANQRIYVGLGVVEFGVVSEPEVSLNISLQLRKANAGYYCAVAAYDSLETDLK